MLAPLYQIGEKETMVVELISVGTEILLGNIVNTNAAYLAERLAGLGMSVYFQETVGDNPERLYTVLKQAKDRSDVVILSGGLGPTQDDLTKEMVCQVMGDRLVLINRSVTPLDSRADLLIQGSIGEIFSQL